MITAAEAQRLNYAKSTLTDADLSAGPDEGTAVPAEQVAEVFNVQVGGDSAGSLSDALAAVVGVPGNQFRETAAAKATFDLQDSTPADVDRNTQVRLSKRKRQERGGRAITGWMLENDYSEIAKINREDLTPQQPGIREDELLTVEVYNPTASVTVSLADSTVQVPVQSGNDY